MSASPIEMPGRTIPVLSLSEAPLPDAALPSKSMVMAVESLAAMDAHAVKVREVAVRLLAEHADLPRLIAVRPYAGCHGPQLDFQPRTNADARLWGEALGVTLSESFHAERDGERRWHLDGDVVVDGVRVHVGACEWVPVELADASEVSA